MPNADHNHDWFSGFQPIVSKAGATGATGATAAEKSRKRGTSDDEAVLHHPDSARATGATRGTEPVAPVAPTASNRCNSQAIVQDEQKQSTNRSVAPVAPEKEKGTNWNDEYEERTAIVEYDGGAPREWAEGFARLDCAAPPPGYSPRQWEQLIDDGGRFLDRWAAEAIGMGWSAEDAFGVHPTAPGARVDAMGLVPLISGGEVVSITNDRASIRMPGGNELAYLRRPRPDAVVLWKLVR